MSASGIIKAVVSLTRKSGVPTDAVVNDWYFHFTSGSPILGDLDDLMSAFEHFYRTAPTGGTNAVDEYLSEDLSRAADSTITFYEFDTVPGSPLGAPRDTRVFQLTGAPSGTPLPDEMAICLSYRSLYGSDVEFGAGPSRPRATHRGRVYLGSLESTVTTEDGTTHEPTVSSTCRTDIVAAAVQSFSAGSVASPLNGTDWLWVQWSPSEWRALPVNKVWVDNAFDVQRRRGARPSLRTTGTIL